MKNEQTKAKKKACPVKLRFNTLKDGTKRIFLASYIIDLATGEANKTRRYTYKTLGLELVEEKTVADRRANKQTMQLAQATAQQIADKYNRQRLGVRVSHSSTASFIDYVSMIEHRTRADGGTGTAGSWHKLILRLEEYARECGMKDLAFADITKDFLAEFIDFLKSATSRRNLGIEEPKPLASRTVRTHYQYLRSAINQAFKEGLVAVNCTKQFDLKAHLFIEDKEREYLELSEIKALMLLDTRWINEKRAFLFSCLTGLRSSDVRGLTWGMLGNLEGDVSVSLRMEKTKKPLYLPISPQALKWLPERGAARDDDKVFPLPGEGFVNSRVRGMMRQLGIEKHVSFHCARHTFATMMLTLGVDLYTVSKLLGHASVDQTQVYARMVDKQRDKAVRLIGNIKIARKQEGK